MIRERYLVLPGLRSYTVLWTEVCNKRSVQKVLVFFYGVAQFLTFSSSKHRSFIPLTAKEQCSGICTTFLFLLCFQKYWAYGNVDLIWTIFLKWKPFFFSLKDIYVWLYLKVFRSVSLLINYWLHVDKLNSSMLSSSDRTLRFCPKVLTALVVKLV